MYTSSSILLLTCTFLLKNSNADSSSNLKQSPQAIVDNWVARQPAGAAAVAIVSSSETEYFFAGQLAPNNSALPNEHTMFEIGSITKGFNGLVLADQVLSGNVFLNDTISKLLTDYPGRFKSNVANVTLLELATHSSGLQEPEDLVEDISVLYTKEKLYAWLDKTQLVRRGSYKYCNSGAALLGQALAINAGKIYEDLLKERVLLPLGLRDTAMTLNNEQQQRMAPALDAEDGQITTNLPWDVLKPAGAIRSSISELANFLQFTIGLKDHGKRMNDVLQLATRYWANTTYGTNSVYGVNTIGLHWFRQPMPHNQLLIWHNGATNGFNSFAGWFPEQQIAVAALININPVKNYAANELAFDLFNLKL